MKMEPDFRKHILALLELGMKYSESAGLTQTRLSELEQHLGLSRNIMREAIKYLGERGLVRIIVDDPSLPYGVSQAFVTDTGRLYYHELLEKSERPIEERYVFISHSSKDSTVVSAAKQAFQDLSVSRRNRSASGERKDAHSHT
jgi:DNA-binding MarR family transcriptional regulator